MWAFYLFTTLLVFLGYKSLRGGINWLNYFKRELSKPISTFTPFVSIIVPCRGLDEDLQDNLSALFNQNYPNYEVIFVVDDENDDATKLINLRFKIQNSKLIVANKTIDSGQKVENLREAVLHVSDESKVFAFVDSDARPNENWLRNLVAPLEDKNIGCTTGYRWFIAKNSGFATQFRSVWNSSIASQLSENMSKNFCWGGSTAISREMFEHLEVRKRWQNTLSDDFTLTCIMHESNLPIYFVPQCLTASVEDCSFAELLEFTTRQMKITRVYQPNLWKASLFGSLVFSAIFWIGFGLLFVNSGIHFWITLTFLSIIFVLGMAKAWVRLNTAILVLKGFENQLNKSFLWQISLWLITPILFFYNGMSALFSRKIVWRGTQYELISANETRILTERE
jgi:ceramide glucosyltransferase